MGILNGGKFDREVPEEMMASKAFDHGEAFKSFESKKARVWSRSRYSQGLMA